MKPSHFGISYQHVIAKKEHKSHISRLPSIVSVYTTINRHNGAAYNGCGS